MKATSITSDGTWIAVENEDGTQSRIKIDKVTSINSNEYSFFGPAVDVKMGSDTVMIGVDAGKVASAITKISEAVNSQHIGINLVDLI